MLFEKRIWNRNCTWSPEEIAVLTGKASDIVNAAVARFDEVVAGLNLTLAQRTEAFGVFIEAVDARVAEARASVQEAVSVRTDF